MTDLLISEDRIDEILGDVAELDQLDGAPIVAVSAAKFTDPHGRDFANVTAAIETLEGSQDDGIPHLVMLDDSSHEDVAPELAKVGAIILPVRGDEGGLARPYITAARIVSRISPRTLMAKFEIAKRLFGDTGNADKLLRASEDLDVITGVRDNDTLDSMPDYLRLTEAFLATAIRDLTGTYDAASGVLVLNHQGRRVFVRETVDPAWQYLIKTPLAARRAGLRVGEIEVGFGYHPLVVDEENGDAGFEKKRRDQLGLMLDGAIEAAGGEGSLTVPQLQTVRSARSALVALERLAAAGRA